MSSSLRARAAATVVAVLALTAVAAPAWAHDELVSSSPQQNEQLEAAPAQVELTFSSDIMQIGAAVIVADGDEQDWVAGDAQIDLDTVTVSLAEGMPEGAYEIRWRVVSADGHPISGLIPFTIGDAAPDAAVTASPQNTASTDDSTTTGQDDGIPRVVLIGAIGAAVALAVFALVLFFLRGRARRDRTGSHDEPTES